MYHHTKKYFFPVMLALILLVPSKDLFSQWTLQASGSTLDMFSIYFLDENTGLLGAAVSVNEIDTNFIGGEIIRTTNGGSTWQRVLLNQSFRLKGFYFLDQNTGYAIGGSYLSQGILYKTTNGGISWQENLNLIGYQHFYNMYFGNQQTGYLSSYNGMYKTTNTGVNWNRILIADEQSFPYPSFRRIHFFDVNTGIFISDSGKVYKTTNEGANWNTTYLNGDYSLKDIGFINSTTGYIVGLNGIAFKTTNQGVSWNSVNFGTTASLYSLKFANGLVGYLTKENGVLKTIDGGNSWQEVLQQGSDTLFSAFFLNPEVGFVGGTNGKVFKTTSGGVIGINNITGEVPKDYLLSQNYPNPFNPATNIKFAIPKAAFVKLAVYDMLGREVESLVNQQLTPGTYEVNWNALKFSSGIYLYKLVTNDFQMVKKMSLIK